MDRDDPLYDWARRHTRPAPDRAAAEELVRQARRRGRRRLAWLVPAGMIAVAAVVFAIVLARPDPAPSPSGGLDAPAPVLTTGIHDLGPDTLRIAPGGRVRVEARGGHARYHLETGILTVVAGARTGGETLRVHAGEHVVSVIGTVFQVRRAPFRVQVREGVVAVDGPDGRVILRAGDTWPPDPAVDTDPPASPAPDGSAEAAPIAPRPPAAKEGARRSAPALPDLEGLTRAVLDGDVDRAREGLRARLRADPTDVEAWRLQARLEAREGQTEGAVSAWIQVARLGAPDLSRQARYEAATLLLDDQPARAVPLLEAYLEDPGPLAPEAALALAAAHTRLGRPAEARRWWRWLVETHPGTAAAERARDRLSAP